MNHSKNVTQLHKTLGRDSRDLRAYVEQATALPFPLNLISGYIAGRMSYTDGYAFPSIENVIQHTRASRATVVRAIAAMKRSGEWTVVSGRGGLPGQQATARSSRYYLSEEMVSGFDAWLERGRRFEDVQTIADDGCVDVSETDASEETGYVLDEEPLDVESIPDFVPDDVDGFEEWEDVQEPEVTAEVLTPFEFHLRELLPAQFAAFANAPAADRERVLALAESLADQGADVYATLSRAVERNTQGIRKITPWLMNFGLTVPVYPDRAPAMMGSSTGGAYDVDTNNVDYGETGQEF